MDELLKLLKENNMMLKEILQFLQNFKESNDIKQFNINVAADLFVEMLEGNKELKEKVINSFNL